MPAPEPGNKSWCLFGHLAHPDGGLERALRIYEDTNSAYCFACAKAWRPVSLMAEVWDCTWAEAADRMCQMAGITEPTWQEKWEALQQPVPPDTARLGEALKAWCRRVRGPSWELEQTDAWFGVPLAACLGLLPLVTTDPEAREWLDGCKRIMGPLLREGMRGDG